MCQTGDPVKPLTVVTPSRAAARAVSLSLSAARWRTPSGSPSPHTPGGTTPRWRASMRSQTAWPTRWLPIVQTFRPWRSSNSRRSRQYRSSARAGSTSKWSPQQASSRPSKPQAPAFAASSVSGRSARWPVNRVTGRAIEARSIGSRPRRGSGGWQPPVYDRGMRIAIAGGGPGGLYLSILLKRLDPAHHVVLHERNAPDDTFGFGVVFSDETLAAFEAADPETYAEITRRFVRWSEIDVHYRGEVVTSGGHGFSALGRKQLLNILQTRAAELGVELHFRSEVSELDGDLVVAADGVNSTLRGNAFGTTLDRRRATYAWFGTPHVFESFTFLIAETERGVVQVHAYPYSESMSTFIVETTDALPLDKAACEALFGYELVENRTRWINFVTVRNERWRDGNLVLLGDAAHTAHFSIGSGTKLAMEDAISLAWAVREGDIDAYEAERRPIVASKQSAAQGSLEWFEGIGRYVDQDPEVFAFNLLTRSRRITYGELRMRDPDFVAAVSDSPPMFSPFKLRSLELKNRVVVSPMDMYSSVDGTPGDFHLVHLGARAIGGAGLVMTEMICTSAHGRITPGCGGLYRDEHVAAWKRIVDFAHQYTAIGCQLGHAGRKGPTKLLWEGEDVPLDEGNWPLIAPSPIPYVAGVNQGPRVMTRADMDDVLAQFVAATRRAEAAGFDLLEVHM